MLSPWHLPHFLSFSYLLLSICIITFAFNIWFICHESWQLWVIDVSGRSYLSIWFVTVFTFLLLKICRYVLQFKDEGMTPPAIFVVGMYEPEVWLIGSYGYWVNWLGTNHFITEGGLGVFLKKYFVSKLF